MRLSVGTLGTGLSEGPVKRFLFAVSMAVALACNGALASTTDFHRVAPADEYFGRLKMSILGIANTIKDQTAMYDARPDLLHDEMHAVEFAVDALHDWQAKYPHDPWIAKNLFALERFYNRIPSDEAQADARTTMIWLVRDFPETWYGRIGAHELAEGKVGTTKSPIVEVVDPAATSTP